MISTPEALLKEPGAIMQAASHDPRIKTIKTTMGTYISHALKILQVFLPARFFHFFIFIKGA